MNELIKEILKLGFSLELSYKNEIYEYKLDGFYKSVFITLTEDGDKLIAKSRYNQVDMIESIQDLSLLNKRWWNSSKDKYEGWEEMDSKWKEIYEK